MVKRLSKPALIFFMVFLLISIPFCLSMEINITYDGNGNLITGDGKYREYNEFNQLIRVYEGNDSSGDLIEVYIWHPTEDRILVKKTNYVAGRGFDSVVVYYNKNFVRDRDNVGGDDRITDTHYLTDDQGIVVEVSYNTTQTENNFSLKGKVYHHNDHLGSTSVLTNESGNIIEKTFYNPHGKILEGGVVSRYDYEGKEFSEHTNDYDYNFRKYDPELIIFTQPDSGIPDVYDPQSLNRYSFERNNPYKYVDPDGKKAVQIGGSGSIEVVPFSGSFGVGLAISYDKEKGFHFGPYLGYSQGLGAPGAVSGTIDLIFTPKAKDIKDLRGHSAQYGGLAGLEYVGGYDYGKSLTDPDIISHAFRGGIGAGVEGHVSRGYMFVFPLSEYIYSFWNNYIVRKSYKIDSTKVSNTRYSSRRGRGVPTYYRDESGQCYCGIPPEEGVYFDEEGLGYSIGR